MYYDFYRFFKIFFIWYHFLSLFSKRDNSNKIVEFKAYWGEVESKILISFSTYLFEFKCAKIAIYFWSTYANCYDFLSLKFVLTKRGNSGIIYGWKEEEEACSCD